MPVVTKTEYIHTLVSTMCVLYRDDGRQFVGAAMQMDGPMTRAELEAAALQDAHREMERAIPNG